MKKIILSLSVITGLLACHSNGSVEKISGSDSTVVSTTAGPAAHTNGSSTSNTSTSSSTRTTTTATNPAPEKPQGWSKAAKGTAIGAGAGAVIGAVVDKNHAQGAVIGGVIGAGTGYVIGRSQDKKSGRVQQGKTYRKYKKTQTSN